MNTRHSLFAAALFAAVGVANAGKIDEVVVTARHASHAQPTASAKLLAESKAVLSSVTPEITLPKLEIEVPKIAADR